MHEGYLTQEQIEEITTAVKKVFPPEASVDFSINEAGQVDYFDIKISHPDEGLDYYSLAYMALKNGAFTREEVADYLDDEMGLGSGDKENNNWLEKINLEENLTEPPAMGYQKIYSQIFEMFNLEYDVHSITNKVVKDMEKIINRCLPVPIEFDEFSQNSDLDFILYSKDFIPTGIGSYRLDNRNDVRKMIKELGEISELAKQAKQSCYKEIARRFMKSLNRTDIEDIEELVKIFDDNYYDAITGEIEFLETFLENIVTRNGYIKYHNHYVVALP